MIRLDGVTVSFGDLTVLDDLDLQVERTEFVGLVGPNGAGKTTLLRTVNGLLTPESGTVRLDGTRVDTLDSKQVSRTVATVPQNTHVGFSFTARQLVEMGRTPHRSRFDWAHDDDPVRTAMARTDTSDLAERTADELSGGELQRVLLARALAQEPAILVLDEPTASLDINHQIRVLGLIEELVREGKTAIAAIHDLDIAARFCDRLVLLHEGSIRASGPPDTVLEDPTIASAYGTATAVVENPVTGTPTIVGLDERDDRSGRIHVVGGGPGAVTALRTLWREGYRLSLGIVPAGDVAATVADQLDIPVVRAPPFEQPTESVRQSVIEYMGEANVVVDTAGPGSRLTPHPVEASLTGGATDFDQGCTRDGAMVDSERMDRITGSDMLEEPEDPDRVEEPEDLDRVEEPEDPDRVEEPGDPDRVEEPEGSDASGRTDSVAANSTDVPLIRAMFDTDDSTLTLGDGGGPATVQESVRVVDSEQDLLAAVRDCLRSVR